LGTGKKKELSTPLLSSSSHDRYKAALEKIAENALKMFIKKGWSTTLVTPILNEVQGNIPKLDIKITGKPVAKDKLPQQIAGWMDVLCVENIEGKDTLVVRSEEMHARIGIDISEHQILKELKTGHKVALVNGEFTLKATSEEVISKYAVMLIVVPSEAAEISYEGEYGFSYLKVASPEES
jgi:hypothetical protein